MEENHTEKVCFYFLLRRYKKNDFYDQKDEQNIQNY